MLACFRPGGQFEISSGLFSIAGTKIHFCFYSAGTRNCANNRLLNFVDRNGWFQGGRQGSSWPALRRPHSLRLDQLGLISPQCALDRLQHWTQLGAGSVLMDQINHPPQDRPFVGVEVSRRTLLNADENVARQQPVSNLSKLAWIVLGRCRRSFS